MRMQDSVSPRDQERKEMVRMICCCMVPTLVISVSPVADVTMNGIKERSQLLM